MIAGVLAFDAREGSAAFLLDSVAAASRPGQAWSEGPVALHQQGRAPVATADASLVAVLDGHLDNADELAGELRRRGCPVSGESTDAELALHSFVLWGEDAPARWIGDFAFVAWDARSRALFCARDHYGARTLYYAHTQTCFAFCSLDDPLTVLPGVSREPAEERIAELLAPGVMRENPPRSWLRDVWAVYPAETLTIDATGACRSRTYWQPRFDVPLDFDNDEDCAEAFREVFLAAVQARIASSCSPGLMLSGGLDSAAIVAAIGRLQGTAQARGLQSFSATDEDRAGCVETQCIDALTQLTPLRAHRLEVPGLTGVLDAEDVADEAWAHSHPVDNSVLIPALMCRAAARHGIDVMLHGVSGDIVLGAPHRYPAHLIREGRWGAAWQECRAAARHHTQLSGKPAVGLLALNAWTAHAPLRLKQWRQRRLHRTEPPPGAGYVNPDFLRRLNWPERWHAERASTGLPWHAFAADAERSVFRRPGLVAGLSGFSRVAAKSGVEVRDPWADRRVVDFVARLPLHYKVRDGWTKYLVRMAFPELPAPARWRSGKEHLGWKLTCSLMDRSQEVVVGSIEDGMPMLSRYLQPDAVRATLARYLSHKSDEDRYRLYEWAVLARWLRSR